MLVCDRNVSLWLHVDLRGSERVKFFIGCRCTGDVLVIINAFTQSLFPDLLYVACSCDACICWLNR